MGVGVVGLRSGPKHTSYLQLLLYYLQLQYNILAKLQERKKKAFGFVGGGGGVWAVRFGHEWWVCKGGNHGGHGSHAARGVGSTLLEIRYSDAVL